MLKKAESAQQEIVKERHIIDLIDGKYQDESQEELPEAETVSEAVPYWNNTDSEYQNNTHYQ